MSFDRYSPTDDDSGKTQGFNDFISSDSQQPEEYEESQKTRGFNDLIGDGDSTEELESDTPKGGPSSTGVNGGDRYDSAQSGAYSKASGDNKQTSQPKETPTEPSPSQKPSPEEKTENKVDGEGAKEPENSNKAKESDKASKENSSDKSSNKSMGDNKSPVGGGKKGLGKGIKGVGGAVGKLAGSVGKFAKNNKGEAAIGAGIMGIFITVAVVILSLAPLKMIDMMEDMFDFHFDRTNSAFDNRRRKTLRQFMREKYGVETDKGQPIPNDVDGDPKKKAFYEKIFTRMFDSKFEQQLRENGYHTSNRSGRLRIYQIGPDGRPGDSPVDDFDLFTEKRKARKAVNDLYHASSSDKGWFRRIFEKRRFQKNTGTKWHWLDPIDQPLNRIKKKVATETIQYLLDNKITHQVMAKLIVKLLGSDLSANNFEDVASKIGTEASESIANETAERVEKEITNEIAGEVAEDAAKAASKSAASAAAQKLITTASGGPVTIVLAIIGVVCTIDKFADDETFQEVVIQYTQLQYMLTFTKFESTASQMKYGNQDGNLDNNVMDANVALLEGENGDVTKSNNFQRANGEEIPYNHTSETANDCGSGKELCLIKQPRCAMYSTNWGKGIMSVVGQYAPDQTGPYFEYCKAAIQVKPGEFTVDNIFNAALEANSQLTVLFQIQQYISEPICTVWGWIEWLLSTIIGFSLDLVEAFVEQCDKLTLEIDGNVIFSPPLGAPGAPNCRQTKNALNTMKEKIGEAVAWISEHILAEIITPVISDQVRGPELANAIGAGADFQANSSLLDLGANVLDSNQALAYQKSYYANLREQHNQSSLVDKIASRENKLSIVNQLISKTPSTPKTFIKETSSSAVALMNPIKLLDNISNNFNRIANNPFKNKAVADTYQNPFGLMVAGDPGADKCKKINPADFDPFDLDEEKLDEESGAVVNCVYGFTPDQLDKPLGSPETSLLDLEVACSMVANIRDDDQDKPEECIKAEERSSGNESTSESPNQSSSGDWFWPLPKDKSSLHVDGTRCGRYAEPRDYGPHEGLDIAAVDGTPVYATKSGKVTRVVNGVTGFSSVQSAGNYIVIDHGDGMWSRYLHLINNSNKVNVGDEVDGGQHIGDADNTGHSFGSHLHFEILSGGERGTPHNPLYYLKQEAVGVSGFSDTCNTELSPL